MKLPCLMLALAAAMPLAYANNSTNPEVNRLVTEARASEQAGDSMKTIGLLQEAIGRDPGASVPLSMLAATYYALSEKVDTYEVWVYRFRADKFANAALDVDPDDGVAQDILDRLTGELDRKAYVPAAAVQTLVEQGNSLYFNKNYAEALKRFDQAVRLDPNYAAGLAGLGDTYAQMGDARAELTLRKAIALDPNYSVAWVSLSELYGKQKKRAESYAAALGAVAALPSSKDNWYCLRLATINSSLPYLSQSTFAPRGSYSHQQKKIVVATDLAPGDAAAWNLFATHQATEADPALKRKPFAALLATWEKALPAIAIDARGLRQDTLKDMLKYYKAGQLKAALFLLHYREAYREEFEQWKKADPEGIKRFVETFHVGH